MAQDLKKRTRGAVFSVTRWIGSVESIAVHTILFVVSFGAVWAGVLNFDRMLLILTTVVSLEAIYLAIFIQMTVNQTTESLKEVEEDIEEIQEDVSDIEEDIGEIQEDLGEETEYVKPQEPVDSKQVLQNIENRLQSIVNDIDHLKKQTK